MPLVNFGPIQVKALGQLFDEVSRPVWIVPVRLLHDINVLSDQTAPLDVLFRPLGIRLEVFEFCHISTWYRASQAVLGGGRPD